MTSSDTSQPELLGTPLWRTIEDSFDVAVGDRFYNFHDAAAAIILAICDRVEDLEFFLEDDTEIYEDIRSWLRFEAQQAASGVTLCRYPSRKY